MHTVSPIGSGINPDGPVPFDLAEHVNDLLAGVARGPISGHPADADDPSATARPEPSWPDDAADALAEMINDQTIVQADALHTDELRAAYTRAKELVGVAFMKLGRQVTISDAYGPAETASTWFAIIDHAHYGSGDTAEEAVNAALGNLDKSKGIAQAAGGCTVPGVASVLAAPHRDKGEALALARRIALRPSYLDTCLQLALPGVADLRPRKVAVAA